MRNRRESNGASPLHTSWHEPVGLHGGGQHRGQSLRRTFRARSLREAKRELAAWRVDLGRNVPKAQSRRAGTSFAAAYQLYIERLRIDGRSENTIENAGYRFRHHLEMLHDRNVGSISRDEILTLTPRLLRTQKPSSVRSIATLGSSVYGEAIRRDIVGHNPFTGLGLPTGASGPKRNLTPEDVHALIDGATDLQRPLVATLVYTGGRVSEVCGLTWGDIDLDAGVVRIAAQLQRGERQRTKTEAGIRGVGVPEQLVSLLREHRRTQVARGVSVAQENFVFASATGKPCDRRRAHRIVQAAARKAGLIGKDENLGVHDLRAGFALNSLRTGMTLPDLQRGLGQKKPDMALLYARIVARDAVIRSSAYDRDEEAEVVELRAVAG
jgi:integrase